MKKTSSITYLYLAGGGLILILLVVLFYLFTSVSKSDETQYIYIDTDDTQDSILLKIEHFGHTAGMTGLKMLARHSNYEDNIHTGRYAIHPGEGALKVLHRLRTGQQSSFKLTIPEVRTMDRLAAFLSHKLMLDSASIATALHDTATCQQLGYDTYTIAAMFVPNTYDVYWDMSVGTLLERMRKEHDRFWRGDRQQKADQIQLTPNEVCTLASIIDEETANNSEKPMIAGMYINRLKQGMPLQADPTIKFALKQFELKRIYNKLLDTKSPYNTYRNEGLPPGPIKIASIQGIDAVLNHVHHDYLYMCAKEDFSGTHNFARTYAEHQQNASRYTRALNERNIH